MTVYPDLAFLMGLVIHGGNVVLVSNFFPIARSLWQRIGYILFSSVLSSLAVLPFVPNGILLFLGVCCSVVFFRGKTLRGTGINTLFCLLLLLIRIALTLLCCALFFSFYVVFLSEGAYFFGSFYGAFFGAIFSFILIYFFLYFRKKRLNRSLIFHCSLSVLGKTVPVRCYADSGNFLTDSVSGLPVVVLEYSVLRRVFGPSFPAPMTYEFSSLFGARARVIPFRGISGTGEMLSAFVPEEFFVEGEPRAVVVAVTPRHLECRGCFDGIIGPQLSEGV